MVRKQMKFNNSRHFRYKKGLILPLLLIFLVGFNLHNHLHNFNEPISTESLEYERNITDLIQNTQPLLSLGPENVSDPAKIGELYGFTEFLNIEVRDSIGFVCGTTEIDFINLTDPYMPEIMNYYFSIYDYVYNVELKEDLGFFANGNEGLLILNISEVDTLFYDTLEPYIEPFYLNSYYNGGDYRHIQIKNDIAYVAAGSSGLLILNISDPMSISEISHFSDGGFSKWVEIYGDYAFVVDERDGIEIYNVLDPQNPDKIVQYKETGGDINSLTFMDPDLMLIADGNLGLRILNISTPGSLKMAGEYIGSGNYSQAIYSDQILYLAGYENGIDILQMDSPDNITKISNFNDGGVDTSLFYGNELLYAIDSYDGLEIIDTGRDSDADGLTNVAEIYEYATNPYNEDSDADELGDGDEIVYYFTSPLSNDTDEDTLSDFSEIFTFETNPNEADSDFDEISDPDEIYLYFSDPLREDSDSDALTDGAEVTLYFTDLNNNDSDFDGLLDGEEILSYLTNPLSNDTDLDLLNDYDEIFRYNSLPTEADSDQDNLTDYEEITQYFSNPRSADTDSDGLLDFSEVTIYSTNLTKNDTDADGISDGDEILRYFTNPLNNDTDGDQVADGLEVFQYKTNANLVDTDSDRLTDYQEIFIYKTNPLMNDTDGDTISDADEITRGLNPTNKDTDGDLIPDAKDRNPTSWFYPLGVLTIGIISGTAILCGFYITIRVNYRKFLDWTQAQEAKINELINKHDFQSANRHLLEISARKVFSHQKSSQAITDRIDKKIKINENLTRNLEEIQQMYSLKQYGLILTDYMDTFISVKENALLNLVDPEIHQKYLKIRNVVIDTRKSLETNIQKCLSEFSVSCEDQYQEELQHNAMQRELEQYLAELERFHFTDLEYLKQKIKLVISS